MNNKQLKLIIIPILLLSVLLLVFFLLTISKKRPQNNSIIPFSPSPTINKLIQQKITQFPTIIPPAFTGAAKDPEIPLEELDSSSQKYILRKKTPFKQNNFSIFFDYSTDMFNVILQDPKDITQASFSAWLNENYSAIPMNRFIVK